MSQDEGKTKKIEKIKWVVPLSILFLSLILLGGFLPVFFDFSKLTCILKAVFIVFYSIGLALVIALAYFDKNNKEEQGSCWKDKVFSIFLYIVYILGFLMFFDHELWGYKETVYGLLFLVVLFLEIYISIKIILGKKLNLEKTSTVLISTAVLTFILAAVNETTNNLIPANLLYKISIGITYLVATALFINSYLFKKRDGNKTIGTIIGVVFWGSLILVTFPYYVQWCGLKENDFQTFVTVYAALIGGGITLAGVAWTIKDSNDKRKEDLQRVENERKEESRKKYIPYIKTTHDTVTNYYLDFHIREGLDLEDATHRSFLNDNIFYATQIYDFAIKNISSANILIKGIVIDEKTYWLKNNMLLEPSLTCKVIITGNCEILLADNIKYFGIIISDIIENEYKVSCSFKSNIDINIGPLTETTSDGVEFKGFKHNYLIENAELPIFISGGKENE